MIKSGLCAAVLAVLLLGSLPAVASAGSGVKLDLQLGSGFGCIEGYAPAGAPFRVVWKGTNGSIKANETYASWPGGSWQVCSADRLLRSGDVIKVALETQVRKFAVPKLTMTIDRVSDLVTGTAPPRAVVHLDGLNTEVVADAAGNWIYEPNFKLSGISYLVVHWSSSRGDRVQLVGWTPRLYLTLDEARFQVFAAPGTEATITLSRETLNGQRVAAMNETFGDRGEIWDAFRDQNGHVMRVHPGDRVSAPGVAADLDWIVPDIHARGSASSNVVSGRCFDTGTRRGWYHVAVLDENDHARAYVWGWVNADGRFSIDFDDPGSGTGVARWNRAADVMNGDRLDVWCQQTTSDYVTAKFDVP